MMKDKNEGQMGNFRIYIVLILLVLITTSALKAQENVNREMVERLYQVLQTRGNGPNDIVALTPGINWKEIESAADVDYRNIISFPSVMGNKWSGLQFKDLTFKEVSKNAILVRGTVSGRQHSECEYITNEFNHSWSLREGEIVQFSE